MAEYTPEQIEEMRLAVAAADKAKLVAAEALRQAYVKPVRDLVKSDEFSIVKTSLENIKANYKDDYRISFQLNALVDIIPRLIQEVELASPTPASTSAPVTKDETE